MDASGSSTGDYGMSGGGGGGTSRNDAGIANFGFRDGVRTGDGLAVITTTNPNVRRYDANGFTWAGGEVFLSEAKYTPNRYAMIVQSDGNLVLYNEVGGVAWSSGTFGYPGAMTQLPDRDHDHVRREPEPGER
ncbi:hypothetical protein ACFPIJ_64335 [Dactylosporangium cerinum]|uniref:Bulb-type lectin domain-containing protein n=1 Tax=Dactylosporangium cerinum TaxID=1434730 RepID=A0ABV9WK23_9ACTN